MRLLVPLFAAQLGLAAGPLDAQGTPEEEFLRLEQEWTIALARRDSALLDRLLSPSFTIIGAGSTTDAAVTDRAVYLRNALRFTWPRREVRILNVQLFGNAAIVRCVWRGTDPPPSAVIPIPAPEGGTFEFLITDVWVRGDGKWQVLARHSSVPSVVGERRCTSEVWLSNES